MVFIGGAVHLFKGNKRHKSILFPSIVKPFKVKRQGVVRLFKFI